jgi:hypothetical protein
MRKAAYALATALLVATSAGVLASNPTVQPPSYDALMAMSEVERRDTFRAMDLTARLSLIQTHIDRWLAENRNRLTTSQIALVTEVRGNLTAERHASDQMKSLERRMRCELWRSDAIALRFIQDPPMSSSWINDLQEWAYDCVVAKAIEAVF